MTEGADGINSIVRPFVVDEPVAVNPPKPSGTSAFRFVIPAKEAMEIYPHLPGPNQPSLGIMVAADGSQRSLAFYPFRDFTMFNFIMLVPDNLLKDPVSGSKNELRSAEDVLVYFHDFPEGIKAILRSVSRIFRNQWLAKSYSDSQRIFACGRYDTKIHCRRMLRVV